MTELKDKVRNYIRTGRRELRALVPQRKTYSAEKGVRRAETKRPAGVSGRQWKKLRGKGQPNPTAALEYFRLWEQASEKDRAAGRVKEYCYFSRRGRQDVRVYWWRNVKWLPSPERWWGLP